MVKTIVFLALIAIGFAGMNSVSLAAASSAEVRQAQTVLTGLGFNPGPIDGLMGKKTRAALRGFQRNRDLPVTGKLDALTSSVLSDVGRPTIRLVEPDSVISKKIPSENDSKAGISRAANSDPVESQAPQNATKQVKSELLKITQPVDTDPDNSKQLLREYNVKFATADWVRFSLLLVLGFGAFSVGGWFIASAVGLGLAFLLHVYVEWMWSWSIMMGIAVFYVVPALIGMLWKSIGGLAVVTVVIGIPTALTSYYAFESDWLVAIVDGCVLAVLAPLAIARVLSLLGVIDIEEYSKYAHHSPSTHTKYSSDTSIYASSAPSQSSSSPISMPDRY